MPGPPPRRLRKSDLPRDELGQLRAPGQEDAMVHLRGLPERISDPAEALRRGIALFDDARFFEAYVHLALAWKRTRQPGHRGLAQVAAGCCHVQRGNRTGAEAILARGEEALATDPPEEVPAALLREQVAAYRAALAAGRPHAFPRMTPPD